MNSTLRFLRCAKGNCIGLESETLQAPRLPILPMWPIEPPAELLISRETKKEKLGLISKYIGQFI